MRKRIPARQDRLINLQFSRPGNRARPRDYALNRLRPFCRRRLITSRPPGVAMRARKPCVRFRRRFDTCNVRFTAHSSQIQPHKTPPRHGGELKHDNPTRAE